MTIVMWVLGAMAVQLVLTVFVVRFIRAGKARRAIKDMSDFDAPPPKVPESGRPVAVTHTYEELSALLTALSPLPDGEAFATPDDVTEGAPQSTPADRPNFTLPRTGIREQ
jgi:hypothetical protein